MPLDPGSFSAWHASNFAPEFIWSRYVNFFEVGRVRGEPLGYLGHWLKGRFVPYAGELRTLNQVRRKRFGFGETLPNGNLGLAEPRQRRQMARHAAEQHFKGVEIMDPGLRWAFGRLLAWARAQGMTVVVVAFPVTQEYADWTDRLGARARVQAEIVTPLMDQPGVHYLDHHRLYGDRPELFSDAHHLNAQGRLRYSQHMREALRDLGVLGAASALNPP